MSIDKLFITSDAKEIPFDQLSKNGILYQNCSGTLREVGRINPAGTKLHFFNNWSKREINLTAVFNQKNGITALGIDLEDASNTASTIRNPENLREELPAISKSASEKIAQMNAGIKAEWFDGQTNNEESNNPLTSGPRLKLCEPQLSVV